MTRNYLILDVFTREPLKGNALAVVLDADGLGDEAMQVIAREFNLSETIFLLKPEAEANAASARIFTPAGELPFAGHPTVGAAVVLGLRDDLAALRIEEKIGLVTATFEKTDRRSGEARFDLPQLPAESGSPPDPLAAAKALGIDAGDIGCGRYRPAVYSAGNLFHLVPVRNAAVLRALAPDPAAWREAFPDGRHAVYIFTETPDEADNDFAARMLKPGMGFEEDPGTGSAAAALMGLLSLHAPLDGQVEYRLRQGFEMGRPCHIAIRFSKENGALVHGAIGGHAVIIASGELDFG